MTIRLSYRAVLAAAVLFVTPGLAVAETLTVTDISLSDPSGYKLAIPTITIEDGNLDEATVRGLFGPGSLSSIKALGTLTATSLVIPEATFTVVSPGVAGGAPTSIEIQVHDVELHDIKDGAAGATVLGSVETRLDEGGLGFDFTVGKITADSYDLGAQLAYYGLVTGRDPDVFAPVYTNFHMDPSKLTVAPGVVCELGAYDAPGSSAKPIAMSIFDLTMKVEQASKAAAQGGGSAPDPELIGTILKYYADAYTSIASEPSVFDGLDCTASEGNALTTTAIAKVTTGAFEPGRFPAFGFDGINAASASWGHFTLGNLTFKPTDLSQPIAVIRTPGIVFDTAWFTENWRKLVPAFEGLSLTGLDFDLPDPDGPAKRIVTSLDSLDLTLGHYFNAVPTDASLDLKGFVFPIPPDATDGTATTLRAAGITTLTIGGGAKLVWDEAARTIAVDRLELDVAQLGRVLVSGTLGNATPELFADNDATAMAAAMTLTLKTATIEVEDHGGASLFVSAGAKEANQAEPAYRTILSGMVQGMALAVLGNDEPAMAASAALGSFVAGSPNLKVTVTARDEAGLGLPEVMAAANDPRLLAGKLDVTAEASGEPVVPQTDDPSVQKDNNGVVLTPLQQEKLRLKNEQTPN